MKWRTELTAQKSALQIDYSTPILAIGSCFAENMGEKLQKLRFPIHINPFGILYNPMSIADCLMYLVEKKTFDTQQIFEHQGHFYSWQHHGRFSALSEADILRGVSESLAAAQFFFEKTQRLIITLGTAHVFVKKDDGQIVANCHKVPAAYFERRRVSVADIVARLSDVFEKIVAQKPDIQIVITVSPIRHLRDGFVENQRSKASLILAAADLTERFEQVQYFPSYEIFMDDLRDYRFYAADLIHPSDVALAYVFDFFADTFFSDTTKAAIKEVAKLNALEGHRPLRSTESVDYQNFIKKIEDQKQKMKLQFPFLEL